MKLLNTYINGSYLVSIYNDGTKTRTKLDDNNIVIHPESIDVKITDYCDAGCKYCHENSTVKGEHGDLEKIIELYSQLPAGVEIAIGGGNPLDHPMLDEFLQELSSKGIICNLTVNEKHFYANQKRLEALISNGCLRGVGYSYNKIPLDWDYEHACTHVIIGISNVSELNNIIQNNNGKLLLLGYKNFRRGNTYLDKHNQEIDLNISSWYKHLHKVIKTASVVSFDNLGIEQLKPKRLFANISDYNTFFMGDDGTHTMYIDAVNEQAALSSTSLNRVSLSLPLNETNTSPTIFELFNAVKKH
jgi:hypothetical protein